jgi:3-oxoacyl-[acyl-carrier protein] reductase
VIGGGGGGIGRAITRALAAARSAVAVADVDAHRADEAAAEVIAAGARSVALVGDVRSCEDVDGFVSDAAQGLDGLDVLSRWSEGSWPLSRQRRCTSWPTRSGI